MKAQFINIDGEQVEILCTSLTIKQLNRLSELAHPRGTQTEDQHYVERVEFLKEFVQVSTGQIENDSFDVAPRFVHLFEGRSDVIETLFYVLELSQKVTAEEARQLDVSLRFNRWLSTLSDTKNSTPWIRTGTDCTLCRREKLCVKRGCDGSTKKQVVWHDKKHVLKTCPVLLMTPLIETTLRLFHGTHDLVTTPHGTKWTLQTLPREGGFEAQDAWTMAAFSAIRYAYAEVLKEAAANV